MLGRRRWPRGLRIAGVSESGGECGLLADHGEEAGIPFAPFDDALKARLIEAFPNYTLPENPLDCWAIDEAERVYPGSLALLRDAGAYDVLLAQVDLSQPPRRARRGVVLADRARRSPTSSRARTSFPS